MKGFEVYANYTYNDSEVENFSGWEGKQTRLPGTALHNYNGSLSYATKRLVLRVSISHHSGFADPDELALELANGSTVFRYPDRQTQVDANGSFAFTPRFRIFAEANNLTNQPLRYYQADRRRTLQSEYYNTRIQAGLKFDL